MFQALLSSIVAALCIQQAVSHPLERRITDIDVLNYALTLEHLENAFYSGALANFSEVDFQNAGLPPWARGRFVQIAAHEATHVAALTAALGTQATQACNYSFPYTDVKSFAALSQVLESVGASAYTGAAQFISTPAYLTVAGSILATEARHAAWISSAVNNGAPFYGSFEVPLPMIVVLELAFPFIVSCPSTNPPLAVKALPSLTIDNPVSGQNTTVWQGSNWTNPEYITFFSGLEQIFVLVENGQVAVPANLSGLTFAVATSNGTVVSVDTVLAGPTFFTL
jgi:hypothetical protein